MPELYPIINLHFRPYTADGFVINEIFSQDCYLSSLIEPGMNVVDIGAHIGCFSALALYRGANVWSYEPDKKNYQLLTQNAQGATLINRAVLFNPVSPNFSYRLQRSEFNTGGGYLNFESGEPVETEQFKGIHQSICIDFLKIDIEGGEADLLQHPEYVTAKYIAIETHNNLFEQFYNFLRDNGYNFIKSYQNGNLGLLVGKKL